MIILKSGFFHQTTSPSPIKDILEAFSFLAKFHRVIQVLKRLPGAVSWTPGVTTKIMELGKF